MKLMSHKKQHLPLKMLLKEPFVEFAKLSRSLGFLKNLLLFHPIKKV